MRTRRTPLALLSTQTPTQSAQGLVVEAQEHLSSVARAGAWPGRAAPMVPDTSKRNLLIFVAAVAIVLGGSQLLGNARLSSQEQTDEQAKATGANTRHTLVQGLGDAGCFCVTQNTLHFCAAKQTVVPCLGLLA